MWAKSLSHKNMGFLCKTEDRRINCSTTLAGMGVERGLDLRGILGICRIR